MGSKAEAPRPALRYPGAVISSGKDHTFDALAGRAVLMLFLGRRNDPSTVAARDLLDSRQSIFDGKKASFVGISLDAIEDRPPGSVDIPMRWLHDPNASLAGRFGALAMENGRQIYAPGWLLLDIRLRVIDHAPIAEGARIFAALESYLASGEQYQADMPAPVLVIPRLFEPDLCRRLIDLHRTGGAEESGVYRVVDGKTVRVMDDTTKRRSDLYIADPALRNMLGVRMGQVLFPLIRQAFQFEATRIERFNIVCYDSRDGGFFRAHRDGLTPATGHRRFACTINLNAEDYEGGDLRFPEFGGRTYRAPTGGAIIFACPLMHEVLPVTQGQRYALLPFLFDEAGARQLEAFQAAAKSKA